MSTNSGSLKIRGIEVDVIYKDIKNLHIAVYPPSGRVRVAAPARLAEEQVRLAVIQRLAWIKQRRQQLQDAARQSPREMVTGESHYVWGRRTRLKVVERPGPAHVEHEGERLLLYVPEDINQEARRRTLDVWYRQQLRIKVAEYLDRWEPIIGRAASAWGLRRMKTKWGSCNAESGRLLFNTELAKKHPGCLEYVVVHELVHLIERNHDERFRELMDIHFPQWRIHRDELNRAPLAHEDWDY